MSLRLEDDVENDRAERAACLNKRKEDMAGIEDQVEARDEGKRDSVTHGSHG